MSIEIQSNSPATNQAATTASATGNLPAAHTGELSSTATASSASILKGHWMKRGMFGLGVLALVASGVALMPSDSGNSLDATMTHTITRGDLAVTITEQGTLESSENLEIKCKVRGQSTVIWVVEGGTVVEPGDELVRLDTLAIEDAIAERTKYAHWSRSGAERSRADVARAELAILEYEEGRYPAEMMTLEKDLAIARSNLSTTQSMRDYAVMMAERGYTSELEVEEREFAVVQAQMQVDAVETEIDVLERFRKKMEIERLNGELSQARAELAAREERSIMDATRRDLAVAELELCVIRAERGGMVIYPSAAEWKETPDVEEGASVHKDQVLLLMPDLSQMQVKVGIHESMIDRVRPGLEARITLPDQVLLGVVTHVASVTQPAGWWTGNVVKYDTIIELPSIDGLKPGMSAEVELILAEHFDVLTIPVSAVIETEEGVFCWVKTSSGVKKRALRIGDSNDVHIVVEAGIKEGDEVILNPLAFVKEASDEAIQPSNRDEQGEREDQGESEPKESGTK